MIFTNTLKSKCTTKIVSFASHFIKAVLMSQWIHCNDIDCCIFSVVNITLIINKNVTKTDNPSCLVCSCSIQEMKMYLKLLHFGFPLYKIFIMVREIFLLKTLPKIFQQTSSIIVRIKKVAKICVKACISLMWMDLLTFYHLL